MSSAWDGLLNTSLITELPFYAINKKLPEDTYFTDESIANNCVKKFLEIAKKNKIDIYNYTFVEPSAGEGCFYDSISDKLNKIALDINPRNSKIEKADFLTWYPKDSNKKYITIGNPPFGVRGAMALAFINRAFLFSDYVAFILPMSFYSNGKGTNMKRVQNASLIYNEKLEENSFYLPETKQRVSINTVFQIWKKGIGDSIFTDYDVSEYVDIYTCCSSPARYCGLGRNRNYNCYIASTFYSNVKIVYSFDDVQYGSGYGLMIKKDVKKILKLLSSTDWHNYCSDATNHCKHIRIHHIKKVLGENGFGRKNE